MSYTHTTFTYFVSLCVLQEAALSATLHSMRNLVGAAETCLAFSFGAATAIHVETFPPFRTLHCPPVCTACATSSMRQ